MVPTSELEIQGPEPGSYQDRLKAWSFRCLLGFAGSFPSPSLVTKNSIRSLRLCPHAAPSHRSPGLCVRNDFISELALKSTEQQPLNICFCGYIFIQRMLSVILGGLHILFFCCCREQFKRKKKKKKKKSTPEWRQMPWVVAPEVQSPVFWEWRGMRGNTSQELRITNDHIPSLSPTAITSYPASAQGASSLYFQGLASSLSDSVP